MQRLTDPGNSAAESILVRAGVQQKIKVIHRFQMPQQTLQTSSPQQQDQAECHGKQQNQPSADAADQKHMGLRVNHDPYLSS